MFPTDPLERVREGMDVVDTSGQRLGKVVRVQAATVPPAPNSDLEQEMTETVPSPADMTDLNSDDAAPWDDDAGNLRDLPGPVRQHLREAGFIEVEGVDLSDAQRFVPSDHIREVDDQRVVVEAGQAFGAVD